MSEAVDDWDSISADIPENLGVSEMSASGDAWDEVDISPISEDSSSSSKEENKESAPAEKLVAKEEKDKEDQEENEEEEEEVSSKKEMTADSLDKEAAKKPTIEIPEELSKHGLSVNEEGEVGILHKANGEERFVSLKDIKTHEAGQVAWDRKFTELDKQRKTFQEDVNEVNSYIKGFSSKMREGDIIGAFEYFGTFANIPSLDIKERLIEALGPEIERRSFLDPRELENEQLILKNKYLNDRLESERQRKAEEHSKIELQNTVNSLRETHGISNEEWSDSLSYLMENRKDDAPLTPELVTDFVIQYKGFQKAESLLTDLGVLDSSDESFVALVQRHILDHPKMSDVEVKALISKHLGMSEQEALGEKLKSRKDKLKPSKKNNKQEAEQPKSTSYDVDWDDL